MGNKAYIELLKDPRWQKKRLHIFELDGFRCRHCCSPEKTLHVHHLYYEKGKMPWEYPDDALVTYCEDCHERVKNVNWMGAMRELNVTEYELLDLFIHIKFKKEKDTKISAPVLEKYKIRNFHFFLNTSDFESVEELDDYYQNYRPELKKKFNG